MSIELLVGLVIIILLLLILIFLVIQKMQTPQQPDKNLVPWLQSMQQSVNQTNANISQMVTQQNKTISDSLSQSSQAINKRLDNASALVAETSKEIGKMNELGQSMKELQLLLRAPKLRGNIGEEILADMLSQVFPKQSYTLQYQFKSGHKVDAVIQTTAGLLCIDAKFPAENFQKQVSADTSKARQDAHKKFISDVKKHINDISQKYILPDEDTVDFAFMYIPSEAIFHEVASSTELMGFTREKRIYPVSPNTLYAHLQTVLLAFEGQQFEKKARAVMRLLKALEKDHMKVDENLQVLGRHLSNASNQFQNAEKQFQVMGQKIQNRDLLEG